MLTVSQATSQAYHHVNKIMPGVMATVDSRLQADPQTLDVHVVTTITHPADIGSQCLLALSRELVELPGMRQIHTSPSGTHTIVTRTR